MALEEADRAIVRRWCGALSGDEWRAADEAFDRLASSYAVALELLETRLSEFIYQVADVASASDRSNHVQNIKPLQARRDELVATVLADPDLNLSAAASTMFTQAGRAAASGLTSVPVNFANDRLT